MISRTSELNPNKNLDTQDIVYYNYYKTPVYSSYEKTPKNGGYIKLPCAYNLKSPNIACDLLDSQYVCSAIYITKALHRIANLSFDGELVLEHTPVTNGFKKVFVCIPLKTQIANETSENPIDIIMKNVGKMENKEENSFHYFSLNQYLNTSERVMLYDSPGYLWNQTVIIFSKPILVNSTFESFTLDPEIFHTYTDSYKVLTTQQMEENIMKPLSIDEYEDSIIVEGMKGGSGNTKTAYCQPIDDIDPSVAQTANLEVPLVGKYSENEATSSMIRIILNFIAFLALLIATFFGIPYIYDIFVIQLIMFNKDLETGQERLNRLRSIDIFFSVIFVTFIFTLITGGISSNNSPQVVVGFLMFMFFVVAFIRVQILKIDATTFLKPFGSNVYFSMIKDDIGNFLKENWIYLLWSRKETMDPKKPDYSFSFMSIIIVGGFFVALMFLAALMKMIKLPKKGKKGKSSQGQFGVLFYILIFSMYIGILVKYFNEKSAGGLSTSSVITRAISNVGANKK